MSADSERPAFPSDLAAHLAALTYDDLPDAAVENVEHCFLDTIGVALAGGPEPAGEIAARVASASSGDAGPATLWGHDGTASVLDAAFANGTASHALDFDDVTPSETGHPSAPMVAPLLAIAERSPEYSGRDLVRSYAAGFEAQDLLAEIVNPSAYQQGWHATATMGTFGAAAAVASLLELSPEETRNALNISASASSGLIRNFGSMTKPMHAGHAARSGATAALLAADGFTGAEDAITGDRGYFDLYYGEEVEYPELSGSPDDLAMVRQGVFFKKYPSCNRTHTSIAATTRLVEEHNIDPGEVESITATTSQRARDVLLHDDPSEPLEGKFSLPYTVANAVVHRNVGIETFTEEYLDDPTVQAIRERVAFLVDDDLPYSTYQSTVEITTDDDTVSQTVVDPPGQYDNQMSRSDLREKFVDCASRVIDDGNAVDEVADAALDLRNADSQAVADLLERL